MGRVGGWVGGWVGGSLFLRAGDGDGQWPGIPRNSGQAYQITVMLACTAHTFVFVLTEWL